MVEKKQWKILVIDDDLSMIKLLEKWLNVAGRAVIVASNGEMGIAKAKEFVPDLILLDLMLPDIGGVEVAKQLKADAVTKEIPIICISSTVGVENDQGDEEIEIEGEQYRIFAKPLHNSKLLSEIRKTINRKIHNNE